MLGVETAMPLMLTEVARGRLSLPEYVRAAAINPAKLWRLYPKKGTIQIGSDADLVIVDPEREARIDQARLHSESKVSSWHGRLVRGLPLATQSSTRSRAKRCGPRPRAQPRRRICTKRLAPFGPA